MAWNAPGGKPRTRLGKFLDKHKITQGKLSTWSGISLNTLTNMCTSEDYRVTDMSKRRVVEALNKNGFDCGISTFW